jgi:hypothetical protein
MGILSHPIPCVFGKKAQPTARMVGWKNGRNGIQEVDRVTNYAIGRGTIPLTVGIQS